MASLIIKKCPYCRCSTVRGLYKIERENKQPLVVCGTCSSVCFCGKRTLKKTMEEHVDCYKKSCWTCDYFDITERRVQYCVYCNRYHCLVHIKACSRCNEPFCHDNKDALELCGDCQELENLT